MASTLTIDARNSIQVKTDDTLTDIVEFVDREVTGTQKFETTVSLTAGQANVSVAMPVSAAGILKYIQITSDLPVVMTINGASLSAIPFTFFALKSAAPNLVLLAFSNANSATLTLRIFAVG